LFKNNREVRRWADEVPENQCKSSADMRQYEATILSGSIEIPFHYRNEVC